MASIDIQRLQQMQAVLGSSFGGMGVSFGSSGSSYESAIQMAIQQVERGGNVDAREVERFIDSMTPYDGRQTDIMTELRKQGYVSNDGRMWSKGQVAQEKETKKKAKVEWDSVILAQEKKDQIQSAISQVKNNETIFEKWGFADVFEKGTAISLLFWGIPGTGKTLTAQAIADQLGKELKVYGTAEIESSEPGGAERTMQAIFKEAKGNKGRIICFDECDSLLMSREEVGPILAAQINALLTEIERFDGIVIFTTNRVGMLDAALERRITSKIEFEFPDVAQRKEIWKRMIPKKAPLAKDVDFDVLAQVEVAGGNIKNAVLNAARRAAFESCKQITHTHFEHAALSELKAVKSFKEQRSKHPHYYQQHGVGQSENMQNTITKEVDNDKFFTALT